MTDQTSGTPKWNTPIGMLHSRIPQGVEDYVLIGKDQNGKPVLFSSGDDTLAKNLVSTFGGFQGQSQQGQRQGQDA